MPRLAEALGGQRASDIIALREPALMKLTRKEEKAHGEPTGEVVETVDLSLCERFGSAQRAARPKDAFITINRRSEIYMGEVVGSSFSPGDRIACYLSPDGTTLVLRREDDGIPCRSPYAGKHTKIVACKMAVRSLDKKGIALPVRYEATWDEQLQAWVGKMRDKAEKRHQHAG